MTEIELFNKEVIKVVCGTIADSIPIVKISGLLLLLAGWLLILSAMALLPPGIARSAFVLAGLGIEATGMVFVVKSHQSGRES